jgi:hypothetical protein
MIKRLTYRFVAVCLIFSLFSSAELLTVEGTSSSAPTDEVYPNIKHVHIIFMTHLDLGFTNFTHFVLQQYYDQYFPEAIKTAEYFASKGGTIQFKWTSHPWLLHQYLRHGTPDQISALKVAIAKDYIQWHAGPFNLQVEAMDSSLFDYSLDLAAQLDRMFNKTPKTVLSQKDVPGFTRTAIPIMAKRGIRGMHVGVNDFSTPPAAPNHSPTGTTCNTFLWIDPPSKTEVVAMWCLGYSWPPMGIVPIMKVIVPNFDHALVFLMTIDNTGPQNPSMVQQGWANTQKMFPNAHLIASSLDAFIEKLWPHRRHLPTFELEMGDTWIYGLASDPQKMRIFREISRQRANAIKSGEIQLSDPSVMEFSELLAKLPEHTWGLLNTMMFNFNYSNRLFHAERNTAAVKLNEASWIEQRLYNYMALNVLSRNSTFYRRVVNAVIKSFPLLPDVRHMQSIDISKLNSTVFECGDFVLSFNSSSGAINRLVDKKTSRVWATPNKQIAAFVYQTYNETQFIEFQNAYNECPPHCNVPDFGKPHLSLANPVARYWYPTLRHFYFNPKTMNGSCQFVLNLQLPLPTVVLYGGMKDIWLNVTVVPQIKSLPYTAFFFDLQWFKKTASRMAEATWFSFDPNSVNDTHCTKWYLNKLDGWVTPAETCQNGSRTLHGVWEWVEYRENSVPVFRIRTIDAPLVAPWKPMLLIFPPPTIDGNHGVHFNLHNNAWNTNYPVWYDDDERFRFEMYIR